MIPVGSKFFRPRTGVYSRTCTPMRLLSFNAFRTLGITEARYLKPERMFREMAAIQEADCLLYPEYWQVNTLVYALKKRIFPSIASYHLGHDKIEQTRAFTAVAQQHVPHTLILPSTPSAIEQILDEMVMPFVAKRVRSSMGEGVYLIETPSQLRDYAAHNEILYVQEYLPLQRDLRVVWVGRKVIAAYWREQGDGFHFNVAQGGVINYDDIPPQALKLVEQVALGLGIDHAGFDIALIDGHPWLLEFNLLFGLDGVNRLGVNLGEQVLGYLYEQNGQPDKPLSPQPIAA